jgi:O-antigen/teichoic acid export membrane protein
MGNNIENNNAFSETSLKAIKNIKYCGIIISILYIVILPFLYIFANKDDAPGILLFACIITAISVVISFSASILQKLFKNVIDMKSKKELSVNL